MSRRIAMAAAIALGGAAATALVSPGTALALGTEGPRPTAACGTPGLLVLAGWSEFTDERGRIHIGTVGMDVGTVARYEIVPDVVTIELDLVEQTENHKTFNVFAIVPEGVEGLFTETLTYVDEETGEENPQPPMDILVAQVPRAVADAFRVPATLPTDLPVLDNDLFTEFYCDDIPLPTPWSTNAGVVSPASWGSTDLLDDGAIRYTPLPGAGGVDEFAYELLGIEELVPGLDPPRSQATVSLELVAPPAADPLSFEIAQGEYVRFDALAPVTGSLPTVAGTSAPSSGGTDLQGAEVTYTPDPGFVGEDAFTVRIRDEFGQESTYDVVITVVPPGTGPSPTPPDEGSATPSAPAPADDAETATGEGRLARTGTGTVPLLGVAVAAVALGYGARRVRRHL